MSPATGLRAGVITTTVTADAVTAYREDIAAAEARRAHRHRMARMDYNLATNAIEGEYDAERRAASQRFEARLSAAGLEPGPAPEYRGMPWPSGNGDGGDAHAALAQPATGDGREPAIGSGTAENPLAA